MKYRYKWISKPGELGFTFIVPVDISFFLHRIAVQVQKSFLEATLSGEPLGLRQQREGGWINTNKVHESAVSDNGALLMLPLAQSADFP